MVVQIPFPLLKLASFLRFGFVFLLLYSSTLALHSAGSTEVSPSKREAMRMVFDQASGRTLLYGGGIQEEGDWKGYSDLWSYDYGANTWTQVAVNSYSPTKFLYSVAYVPDLQKLIIFGGWGEARFDDTWIFDIGSKTWTQISPAVSPPARQSAAMAYDEVNKKIVMFGGYGQNDVILGDTWIFDPSTNMWTEMKPISKPLPSGAIGEYGSSMVYDTRNGKLLMFGGHWVTKQGFGNSTHGYSNDVWVYDLASNNWSMRETPMKPDERYWLAAAYDSDQAKLIIYGGFNGFTATIRNDTWSYDYASNSWTEVSSSARPPSRLDTSMAYDRVNHKMILFGGITGSPPNFQSYGDTWALSYSGSSGTWEQRMPTSTVKPPDTAQAEGIPAYSSEIILSGLILVAIIFYLKRN